MKPEKKKQKTDSSLLKLENQLEEKEHALQIVNKKKKPKFDKVERPAILNKVDEFFTSPPPEEVASEQNEQDGDVNKSVPEEAPVVEMNIVTIDSDMKFFLDESDLVNNFFNTEIRKNLSNNWTDRKKDIIQVMSKAKRHLKRSNPTAFHHHKFQMPRHNHAKKQNVKKP